MPVLQKCVAGQEHLFKERERSVPLVSAECGANHWSESGTIRPHRGQDVVEESAVSWVGHMSHMGVSLLRSLAGAEFIFGPAGGKGKQVDLST